MLSYQHLYHAGNAADVHKHALLAWTLAYLTTKDKPLSYMESHAGRGLYDLAAPEAVKTGEAAQGIAKLRDRFAPGHPYARALADTVAKFGPSSYPGSPLIAAALLRSMDNLTLAELHPGEYTHLTEAMPPYTAHMVKQDGWTMALSRTPPTPRRGLLLIDPSWEVKDDYDHAPKRLADLHKRWNVGVLMLWYPVLTDNRHVPMTAEIARLLPDAMLHEVRFPPARPGHGMIGSGLVIVNPPFGLAEEAARVSKLFATHGKG